MKTLREVKKGEYFKISHNGRVWVKGDYVCSEKKFSCFLWEDINRERFLRADRPIYTEFEF